MRRCRQGRLIPTATLVLVMLVTTPAVAGDGFSKQQQLVDKAKLTIEKFAAEPNIGWSPDQAGNIKGILIVPQLLKGAFLVGGEGGTAVLLLRDEETGEWSHPAFFALGALSFGLQAGGDASEMVVVIKHTGAKESFYSSSFKLGGDASVAAGPAGGGVKGWTRLILTGGMVGYMVSQGIYAGVSVEGVAVASARGANGAYYGQGTRPTDILVNRTVSNPGAEGLREAVANAMKTAKTAGSEQDDQGDQEDQEEQEEQGDQEEQEEQEEESLPGP